MPGVGGNCNPEYESSFHLIAFLHAKTFPYTLSVVCKETTGSIFQH